MRWRPRFFAQVLDGLGLAALESADEKRDEQLQGKPCAEFSLNSQVSLRTQQDQPDAETNDLIEDVVVGPVRPREDASARLGPHLRVAGQP